LKIFTSLLLKLQLLYALVFSVSLVLIFAAYYYASVQRPLDSIKRSLREEAVEIAKNYRNGSTGPLRAALQARADADDGRTAFHVLLDRSGRVSSANLPQWPGYLDDGWLALEAHSDHNGKDSDHAVMAWDQRLPNGTRVILGRDIEDIRQRTETLIGAALWLIIGCILFGLLGGILVSRVIGRRIDLISMSARRVMAGDLNERIPHRGSKDDFYRLSETLNLMLDRIQSLLTSLRRVSDSVAHEMRTPLTRLHADLSDAEAAPPDMAPELVASARNEAENVIAMFDAVLRIGRIESVVNEITLASTNISVILIDVAEMFAPSAHDKNIALLVAVEESLIVRGHRDLLFQAFGNIVDNAIKYSSPSGTVRISGRSVEGRVAITVEDNGRGIPEDQRELVFERFVRLRDTASAPGLGLGLSFVKVVADVHGSQLVLRSANPGLRLTWLFHPTPL
jgi:signal transduction histidine kinase